VAEPSLTMSYRQESRQRWIDAVKYFKPTYDLREKHLKHTLFGVLKLVWCALRDSSHVPKERVEPQYVTLYLVGKCPACGHQMDKVIHRRHADDDPKWDKKALVYCNCTGPHPNQPPGRTGCGGYGWLMVEPPGQDPQTKKMTREPFVRDARTAKPDDLRWELQAEELYANRLADTRATAGKWTAAITSITGVFGIVALIKGPSDISGLDSPWRYVVYSLVALAILTALLAIGLAAAAAEGTPRTGHLAGSEAQFWESWQVTASKHELTASRKSAYLAVLAMLAAIVITWAGPT
jgi:hypothetical protein